MSDGSRDSAPVEPTRNQTAAGQLLLPRLEEHRDRLFEKRGGRFRYGDGGLVMLTLTNEEARRILGADHEEGRNDDAADR